LPEGRPVAVRVAGRDIALFRTPGGGLARSKTNVCIAD
jgi:hypothetical protein